ncbi:hypothetical protein SAMN06265795_12647 [Noviherbaspirillum humi]|uniref:DNA transfer protein n=1 Tax=Noviherbaspirillum humi TaxID=1688639 RepID=A0A239LU10_9BURK|nr:hypothetical protein [Noviherbaspirillum humi]SNT33760.1 hypothetical protein SAMN06265795_12647 [Noviherbaspirillum humi]
MSVGWVAAGATLVSGYMGSKAAGDAADAQAQSARDANQTQWNMFNQTQQTQQPWVDRGNAAGNRLQYLLGISSSGSNGVPSYQPLTKASLVDTSAGDWRPNADLYASDAGYRNAWDQFITAHQQRFGDLPNLAKGSDLAATQEALLANSGLNLDALNASRQQATQQQTQSDPAYGSLLRNFSAADLQNDPVYQSGLQFGLDEVTKGINNMAAASGSLLSGATLKALTKYGNDYASTKANDAFNRFQTQNTNTYNRLAGVAGTGQQANALVASVGQNMANNVSQNQIGVGNARAASAIGSTNALTNGISQGWGLYQGNQLYSKLLGGGGGGGGGGNALGSSLPTEGYSGMYAELGLK